MAKSSTTRANRTRSFASRVWWWIDHWRASPAYRDFTIEEQAAYRNLLEASYLRGVLPAEEHILANLSGDAVAWPRVRAQVLARFEQRRDGCWCPDGSERAFLTTSRRDPQAPRGRA